MTPSPRLRRATWICGILAAAAVVLGPTGLHSFRYLYGSNHELSDQECSRLAEPILGEMIKMLPDGSVSAARGQVQCDVADDGYATQDVRWANFTGMRALTYFQSNGWKRNGHNRPAWEVQDLAPTGGSMDLENEPRDAVQFETARNRVHLNVRVGREGMVLYVTSDSLSRS